MSVSESGTPGKWQRRTGIMLCYPFEEKRLAKWHPPFIVQPKLDGVRCRAIVTPTRDVLLLSSEEHPLMSVPHINKALRNLGLPPGTEIDGELYTHGMSFEEIVSRTSRTVNVHHESELIQYHAFDLVEDAPQLARLQHLYGLGLSDEPSSVLTTVRSSICTSLPEIERALARLHDQGYEGIIVRHHAAHYVRRRSTAIMKWKPTRMDDYQIIGCIEEVDQHGTPKNALGALECVGDDGTVFRIGTGFTREQREGYWRDRDTLPGHTVTVKYQHLTRTGGVPRFPVFHAIVENVP